MAEFQVFRLKPYGAFHFGAQGVGLEVTVERCPSDTLYAALLMEAQLAGLSFPQPQPDGAFDEPPFRLSSCLPYAGEALLFPLPRLKPTQRAEPQPGQRKRIKQIQYVSLTILRRLLAGGALAEFVPDQANQSVAPAYQDGAVLIAGDDDPKLAETSVWSVSRVDHVTVDRAREASQYYAVGQVRFADGCGLYVLAQVGDEKTRDLVFELLTRLGHAGLGGRRSMGLGQFRVQPPFSIELPDSLGCERAMLLARYLPSLDELRGGVLGPGAAYELVRVSGWLQTNETQSQAQQRKSIHLLSEGSVVRCVDRQPPAGRVVDVRPEGNLVAHPVWRYGLALTVGVTMQETP